MKKDYHYHDHHGERRRLQTTTALKLRPFVLRPRRVKLNVFPSSRHPKIPNNPPLNPHTGARTFVPMIARNTRTAASCRYFCGASGSKSGASGFYCLEVRLHGLRTQFLAFGMLTIFLRLQVLQWKLTFKAEDVRKRANLLQSFFTGL